MLFFFKCIPRLACTSKVGGLRSYSLCCPPKSSPCGQCGASGKSARRIMPPSDCSPRAIPPNPCAPVYHGKDTWKKFKYLALFFFVPLILLQMYRTFGVEPPHKLPCRDYEYMRIRTKRFPWGDGVKSLFHNDHANYLPGDCEPPPLLDCETD